MSIISSILRFTLLSYCCIALRSHAPQNPAESDQNAAQTIRRYVTVNSSTTVIKEKSVSLLSSLQASQNVGLTRREGFVKPYNDVPKTKMAERAEREDPLSDMQAELPNGATYYIFQLLKKEHLKVGLTCEVPGMVWMQFMKPPLTSAMTPEFLRANRAPKNLRSKKIEITNVTDNPYEVVLAVYGTVNYPYTLDIGRKSK